MTKKAILNLAGAEPAASVVATPQSEAGARIEAERRRKRGVQALAGRYHGDGLWPSCLVVYVPLEAGATPPQAERFRVALARVTPL